MKSEAVTDPVSFELMNISMNTRQILLALLVPATWGLGFTLSKIGMFTFPPLMLMSMRFGLAALVLIWFTKPPWPFMKDIFMISLVSGTIQYGLAYYGLQGLDASTAILVVQLEAPFLALFGAFILKEQFTMLRGLGMLAAFAGVAVIAGEPRLEGNLFYVALVASAAIIWSFGQIMVRRLKSVQGSTLLAWVALISSIQMIIISLIFEEGHLQALENATLIDWSIVVYLGLIMTALGYSVWYHLVAICDVSQLSPFLMLNPVTSIIAGIVLLDEVFTSSMAIGALMILSGVAATTINWKRWQKSGASIDKSQSEL
jgi:O-acetylserine/cysteine efflux transporter